MSLLSLGLYGQKPFQFVLGCEWERVGWMLCIIIILIIVVGLCRVGFSSLSLPLYVSYYSVLCLKKKHFQGCQSYSAKLVLGCESWWWSTKSLRTRRLERERRLWWRWLGCKQSLHCWVWRQRNNVYLITRKVFGYKSSAVWAVARFNLPVWKTFYARQKYKQKFWLGHWPFLRGSLNSFSPTLC